jgi:hypothetical protein
MALGKIKVNKKWHSYLNLWHHIEQKITEITKVANVCFYNNFYYTSSAKTADSIWIMHEKPKFLER